MALEGGGHNVCIQQVAVPEGELPSSEPRTAVPSLLKHPPVLLGQCCVSGLKGIQRCQACVQGRGEFGHVDLDMRSFREEHGFKGAEHAVFVYGVDTLAPSLSSQLLAHGCVYP
jgi:hypothetical protein